MDHAPPPKTPHVRAVRRAWEHLAGSSARFSPPATLGVVVAPASRLCPPGWCGLVTIAGATVATAPDEFQAQVLQRGIDHLLTAHPAAAAGLTPETSSALVAALPVRDVLGPTDLAYLPHPFSSPPAEGPDVHTLDVTDPLLQELLDACPADDVAEAALDTLTSPAFAVLRDGAALAVAGYELWPGSLAHLCVLTHPAARGAGSARAAAGAATGHALRAGLLPQWRARPLASRRVAHALGYQSLGHQVSLRLGR